MFTIVEAATGESVGSVGYWERESHGGQVYETGWMVLPEFQGHGIATDATAQVIDLCRAERSTGTCTRIPRWKMRRRTRSASKLGFEVVDVDGVRVPDRLGQHPALQRLAPRALQRLSGR